jgi:hypothetical protein
VTVSYRPPPAYTPPAYTPPRAMRASGGSALSTGALAGVIAGSSVSSLPHWDQLHT